MKSKLDEEIRTTWEKLYPGTFELLISFPEEGSSIYFQCRNDILIYDFSIEEAVIRAYNTLAKYKYEGVK